VIDEDRLDPVSPRKAAARFISSGAPPQRAM